jgi:murein L,D-transpeptidase YafK
MNKLLYILLIVLFLTGCGLLQPSRKTDEIVVLKSERKLILLHDNDVYKMYEVGLGQDPDGHKVQEGDSRTPEGEYLIDRRNPNSKYYLSLGISYPDEDDIAFAEELGVDPGNHIMIHGVGDGRRKNYINHNDWTEGCIAVTNEEMHELWHLIDDGTPITIYP